MALSRLTHVTLPSLAMSGVAHAATLHIGNGAEPGSLDPQKTSGTWETRITRALFDRLIDYAADGSLIPGLAETWRISDDSTTYTFHLRDAEWSDPSTPSRPRATTGLLLGTWSRVASLRSVAGKRRRPMFTPFVTLQSRTSPLPYRHRAHHPQAHRGSTAC